MLGADFPASTSRDGPAQLRTTVCDEQAEDIGADLGWVEVPFAFPVTVNLPTGTGQYMPVGCAPRADRLIRLVKQVVRPEMGRCGHEAWRSCRDHHLTMPAERPVD